MKTLQAALVSFAVSFFIIASLPGVIRGQEEELTFQKAYDDHVFTQQEYEKAHEDYLLARSQYLQAGTLPAQISVQEKTTLMLQKRDDVVVTYLKALRLRLAESVGVSEINREGLFSRVDTEVRWFEDHRGRVASAGDLGDLVNDSTSAADHYDEFTSLLIFEVLSTIPIGKVTVIRQSMANNLERIKTKTNEIKLNGDLDVTDVEKGINEIQNKLTRSLDKQLEAQVGLQAFKPGQRRSGFSSAATNYNNILGSLDQSLQLLREASSFTRQVLKSIKTQN